MSLEESVFFYTRNSYLIINSLLCGRNDQFWDVCRHANKDSVAIIEEFKTGVRKPDLVCLNRHQSRVFKDLTPDVKHKLIKTATSDADNLLGSMAPIEADTLYYRSVIDWKISESYNEEQVGESITFPNITSVSKRPYREDEERKFYRYEIMLPKGYKRLDLDIFDESVRNEEGEVLLPPCVYEVTSVQKNVSDNCKGIIKLKCLSEVKPVYHNIEL